MTFFVPLFKKKGQIFYNQIIVETLQFGHKMWKRHSILSTTFSFTFYLTYSYIHASFQLLFSFITRVRNTDKNNNACDFRAFCDMYSPVDVSLKRLRGYQAGAAGLVIKHLLTLRPRGQQHGGHGDQVAPKDLMRCPWACSTIWFYTLVFFFSCHAWFHMDLR